MTDDLHNEILDALKDRGGWESKQATLLKMRHEGLRRKFKPYEGASDFHYPLGDRQIEKLKPFYFQQIYATETVASFVSQKQQEPEFTTQAAYWFDYQLKQLSNFEREVLIAIDGMEQSGGSVVKGFWNVDKKCLGFDACDPFHVIVPKYTEELRDADWIVHVLHYSEAQYRRKKLYRKDDDFVKGITGKGNSSEQTGNNAQADSDKETRQGITYGTTNQIVVWEVYSRIEPNGGWLVETVSPLRPKESIRASFKLPYNKGVFAGAGRPPFMRFRSEIKEKGYYSSRGIMERVAPLELAICKSFNAKHDYMDFANQPTYTSKNPLGNTNNIKLTPGAILPDELKPNVHPSPPISFDEDLNFLRTLAEDLIGIPDFGVVQTAQGSQPGGKRTATEVNAMTGLSGQSNDIRARIFRLDLGELLNMAWSLLLQYSRDNFAYVLDEEQKQMPVEALHDCYQIMPNGSADSWNKGAQQQKALARFQLLQGNPYIKQDELVKSVIALDEPQLVRKLFVEPQDAQAGEVEEQHTELLLMENRFAAATDPTDDDKAHLQTIAQWFPIRMQEQPQIGPVTAQLVFKHIQEHGAALHQKKNPAVRQFDQMFKPISAVLLQIAQSAQQQANVVPMQQEATV